MLDTPESANERLKDNSFKKKGACDVAQRVEARAAKPGDLSSIQGSHVVFR